MSHDAPERRPGARRAAATAPEVSCIAVLNSGSATLRIAVLDVHDSKVTVLHRAEYDSARSDRAGSLRDVLAAIDAPVDAIGHRVVHGGSAFHGTVRIDRTVIAGIERLIPLAPLHNARALEGIRAAEAVFPELPGFAVFDTAFHAARPEESVCYALPADIVNALSLRRYGFHGIAHAALAESLAAAQGIDPAGVTAVTLQLGSGCSACAIDHGRSIETSMGYTPLEGLVMASRCGDIDPAIVLQLARAGYELDDIEHRLTRRSGLLALAGSGDMREILAAEAGGDAAAARALRVFVYRVVLTVGAYLTLLEGRGAIVFGGGIGTHSAEIRRRVCAGLAAWNVEIDTERNAANTPGRISTPRSRDVSVFSTDEEAIIARESASLLDG